MAPGQSALSIIANCLRADDEPAPKLAADWLYRSGEASILCRDWSSLRPFGPLTPLNFVLSIVRLMLLISLFGYAETSLISRSFRLSLLCTSVESDWLVYSPLLW